MTEVTRRFTIASCATPHNVLLSAGSRRLIKPPILVVVRPTDSFVTFRGLERPERPRRRKIEVVNLHSSLALAIS